MHAALPYYNDSGACDIQDTTIHVILPLGRQGLAPRGHRHGDGRRTSLSRGTSTKELFGTELLAETPVFKLLGRMAGIDRQRLFRRASLQQLEIMKKLAEVRSLQWGAPSASDPRAKNTRQRATKGTVPMSQSLSPWCDCRRLGSTWASWRWQDINVGNPL